ncbi:eCIS core domain-containing protein [Lacinutrix chionoecetis]
MRTSIDKAESLNRDKTSKQLQSEVKNTLKNNTSKAKSDRSLQLKIQESENGRTIQHKKNKTGLPDSLKSGVEALSGHTMDDVKVHYNSSKPAKVQAHAYAQGNEIHLASGQEKHLPHEAWHVAQQKQGRVQPTTTVAGMAVNDNVALEKEADDMGSRATQMKFYKPTNNPKLAVTSNKQTKQLSVIQLNGKSAKIKLSKAARKHYKDHNEKSLPKTDTSLIELIREDYNYFKPKGNGEWVLDLDEYETTSKGGKDYKMWTIILVEIGAEGEENYLVKHYGPSKSL